tara:strand:- start:62 stop:457 length:396 start_codon:yes stop_codon:yes gene_type:complete
VNDNQQKISSLILANQAEQAAELWAVLGADPGGREEINQILWDEMASLSEVMWLETSLACNICTDPDFTHAEQRGAWKKVDEIRALKTLMNESIDKWLERSKALAIQRGELISLDEKFWSEYPSDNSDIPF